MIHPSVELNIEYSIIDVDGNTEVLNQCVAWCSETFGPQGKRWFYRFKRFYFRDSKDAMWFELKW